jgi:hypothetical protein
LLQAPSEHVSALPGLAVPEIAGRELFDGGGGATTAVRSEVAGVEPPSLDPVTITRIVWPTSLSVSGYVFWSSPVSTQFSPFRSQSCHW